MKEPVLLIMAAGLGSRYGGNKQIDPVGAHGEIIIDYSLYDAVRAGFKKAVFVIKEENYEDFKELILPKAGRHMQTEFAFQKIEDLPEGIQPPEGRTKPWGTGQAVLAAAPYIDGPFAVVNADDFYGREAFQKIYDFLVQTEESEILPCAMVGFLVGNTVTDNGYVSRGVCQTKNGMLTNVVERTHIEKRPEGIAYLREDGESWQTIPADTLVSMNLWGFTAGFFPRLREDFRRFLTEEMPAATLKAEFYLPFVVNDLLQAKKAEVQVLSSHDKWYGVTYQQDKKDVQEALARMTREGIYPAPLWG